MNKINEALANELAIIAPYLHNHQRLIELFQTLPTASIDVFNITAENYANKMYDELNSSNQIIPHGFYGILISSIKKVGLISTLKQYEHELSLIAETMDMSILDLKMIIKDLREPKVEDLKDRTKRLKAEATLKDIIRRFSSKYKENYLKRIINERKKQLEPHITYFKVSENKLPIEQFIKIIKEHSLTTESIKSLIYRKLQITLKDKDLDKVIRASFESDYTTSLITALNLNISEPKDYEYFKSNKSGNRLKNNYERKLNIQMKDRPLEEKEAVLKLIICRTKAKKTNTLEDCDEYNNLKVFVRSIDINLAEEISSVMSQCENCSITLNNGTFSFNIPKVLTKEEVNECRKYTKFLASIKSVHNVIQQEYAHLNKAYQLLTSNSPLLLNDTNNYEIDITPWFKSSKIIRLLGKLNIRHILTLAPNDFAVLKRLLLDKGLLWAYITDNIDLKTIAVIINNFEYIVNYCQIDKLTSENFNEIIKKAYLYGYADEVLIGLVGIDNVAKIINYNQFAGVTVTDEVIKKRLNKVTDLAVRSERYNHSSLPFDCSVKKGEYTLSRYQNNDPAIFTSGIDTKTCFFVSVNENDFFFYSLIHKDGYVLKITNEKGEIIARASCFRKNNVLMINGIRCKNNKVIPENQEEFQEMLKIVDLIKLMAQKMISMTKDDECPIDYVVCNRAGILENAYFEDKFEMLNPILFKEPINVYSKEWEEFVHLYDEEDEQLLQEVPSNPEHSFTTDFGDHYPALLIASRDYRGLLSPHDITLNDQPETYRRPRKAPEVYIKDEITPDILARINRIRALACFIGDKNLIAEKRKKYHLITNIDDIESIVLGDDWVIIYYLNQTLKIHYANNIRSSVIESAKYVRDKQQEEQGVKLYYIPKKELDN